MFFAIGIRLVLILRNLKKILVISDRAFYVKLGSGCCDSDHAESDSFDLG